MAILMSPDGKLSSYDVSVILAHNKLVTSYADNAIETLKQVPKPHRTEGHENLIRYWQHVKKALKWSSHHARLRQRKDSHGIGT